MAAIEELLGNTVKNQTGEVDVSSFTGAGKVVGLYFSAHWCPPCQQFTPLLAKYYLQLKSTGKQFEIVFISSDKDENAFKSYFQSMPWLALDFNLRDKQHSLSEKFDVEGIPTLILLDGATGEIITNDGRSIMFKDPTGSKFPWKL